MLFFCYGLAYIQKDQAKKAWAKCRLGQPFSAALSELRQNPAPGLPSGGPGAFLSSRRAEKRSAFRRMNWKLEGRGKSGGVRVIYYWVVADDQIRMLYTYPKGKQENLTAEQLAALRKIVERWSDE